jgi:Arc/MetJ-type ribon-helix-helix transcriptional regulator
MKRATISLPDELASAVAREAERRRTSFSEVTREALLSHLGIDPEGRRELAFAGIGRSGKRTTARDAERILAREWGGRLDRRR